MIVTHATIRQSWRRGVVSGVARAEVLPGGQDEAVYWRDLSALSNLAPVAPSDTDANVELQSNTLV